MQLGHNMTLLHEIEEKDISSFNNYLRMDTHTFDEILERITPGIIKLTTNYKEPIQQVQISSAWQKQPEFV